MSVTKITPKKRLEIIERDNNKCLWCGQSPSDGIPLEVDHVVAESFGGKTTNDNLGTLCRPCNRGKGSDYKGNYLLESIKLNENIWSSIEEDGPFSKPAQGCEEGRLMIRVYNQNSLKFSVKKIIEMYRIEKEDNDETEELANKIHKETAMLKLKRRLAGFIHKERKIIGIHNNKIYLKS